MNWIMDHLQLLIGAAAAVAYWLNQRREAKTEPAEEQPDDGGEVSRKEAPEHEESTVLVPDDIRRRILEQLGIPQPEKEPVVPPPTPPPLPPPPPLPVLIPNPQPVLSEAVPVAGPVAKPMALRPRTSSLSARRDGLRRALRSSGRIREAILLREILGPPVGLKPADRSRVH